MSTPASLPYRARVAPQVPSHRSQGQERCSCQEDFCQERTLPWALSHHPATLTRSECAAHGFQAACDFWRKLWQVTSLPGLPSPAPRQERLSHSPLCVSFHGATLQAGSSSPQPSLDRAAVGHPLHNLLRHSEHKPSVHVLCPSPQDGLPPGPSFRDKRPSFECSTICQTQGAKGTAWWGDETHELRGHAGPERRPGLGTPSVLTPLQEAPRPLSPWQSLEHPAESGSGSACLSSFRHLVPPITYAKAVPSNCPIQVPPTLPRNVTLDATPNLSKPLFPGP